MTNESAGPPEEVTAGGAPVISMDDIRRQAAEAMGPPPKPGQTAANMTDGQTMAGFDWTPEEVAAALPKPEADEEVQVASREFAAMSAGPKTYENRQAAPEGVTRTAAFLEDGEAEQGSYLPPAVPDGHLAPPLSDAFADQTWMMAGAQFEKLVDEVLGFEEFAHLAEFRHWTIWHRLGRPKHPWRDLDGEPTVMLAQATIADPLALWSVKQSEDEDALPHFYLGFYYLHFNDLREEGMYYSEDVIKMQIHWALSRLSSESGILAKRAPSVVIYMKESIERWGLATQGLRALQKPMLPFMTEGALKQPGFGDAADE